MDGKTETACDDYQRHVWEIQLMPRTEVERITAINQARAAGVQLPNWYPGAQPTQWYSWCWRGKLEDALQLQQHAEYVSGLPARIVKVRAI